MTFYVFGVADHVFSNTAPMRMVLCKFCGEVDHEETRVSHGAILQ